MSELLINAIEHGNCEITSEEKTAYLEKWGSIHSLIAARCQIPEIAKRRVVFNFIINNDDSHYSILDEGNGFDWRRYATPDRELDFFSEHGRGIFIAQHNVSGLTYNEKGNQVEFTIRHKENTANPVPNPFLNEEVVLCQEGDVICREGEESSFLYYVAEGEYAVMVNNHVISSISPADVLMGEMSFLLEERRSATVIASSPGRLIKISRESFVNALKTHPYLGIFLSKLLAQRLQQQSRKLENISYPT